ncbi:MAG: aminotransferase class I/II-fold pyridoxal phosphate-dependent enzyme [Nitrospiraceae bacterium]|nr:aminotransferase class I/II-fold pyridoxal phosphate-dependent enzyme [Nitrospiraceae bacterium]
MNESGTRSPFLAFFLNSIEEAGRVKRMPPPLLPSLSSNNYLGLAGHPKVIEASIEALRKSGAGSTGSRYLSGNHPLNEALETRIAHFKSKGAGAGLIFSSGYHANLSAVSVFGSHAGAIYSDAENHASLIDGLRLLKKPIHVYPHRNWEWIRGHLRKSGRGTPMIVSESLFSMSGDLGPIPELLEIVRETGGILIIDDAHATGTLGTTGRGGLEHFSLEFDPDHMIVTGTFSKALGSHGGFAILGEAGKIILTSLARPLIYTTALPPAVLAASLSSLDLLEADSHLPKSLQTLSEKWQTKLTGHVSLSPILNLRGDQETLELESSKLMDLGFAVPVLRYPTVPFGEERLRISVNLTWAPMVEEALLETFSRRIERL